MGDIKTELGKFDKKKSVRTFQRCKPIAVLQLTDNLGREEAAIALGITASGLGTIIGKDDCSVTMERLAEQLLFNEGKHVVVAKNRLIIARVPPEHAEAVRTVLNAMNVKTWDFAE